MIDMTTSVDSIVEKLSRNALDSWEIFSTSSEGLTIEVKDGALDVFVASENTGMSVRALKENQLGFSYSTDTSPGALSELADRALQGLTSSDPDPFFEFPSSSGMIPPQVEQFDDTLESLPFESKN